MAGPRGVAAGRAAPGDLLLIALVACGLALGGGGSPSPLPELALEWLALLAIVAAAWSGGLAEVPRAVPLFVAAAIALPALQLVPLPPGVWQDLPGRQAEVRALALVAGAERWMPWSLSPPRTLAALLALVPPLVALVLAAGASIRGRTLVLAAIVAMGLVSVVLGAGQLAGGDHGPLRFYPNQPGSLAGFQANRNATADVLICALLALAALLRGGWLGQRPERMLIAAGAAALLVAGTVLTGSRAGIALLAAALVGLAAWLAVPLLARIGWRRAAAAAAGAVLAMVAAAWSLAGNLVVTRTLARFGESNDSRRELWADTWYAIGQHWPWGSGLGSFVPVFIAAERLEVIDSSRPNRAHNDYLELALEGGLPALLLLAGIAAVLLWRLAWRLHRAASPEERSQLVFAGAALSCLALHSIVDYPLRSMSLAILAGVAAAIVLVPGGAIGAEAVASTRRRT